MHTYDPKRLERYLAEHVPGFAQLDRMEKFSGGQSNPTYLLSSAGQKFVLRAKPPGDLLPSAHRVDREYRVMNALAPTQVPVPRMLHLSDEDSPLGAMFFVMEHVDGTVHWDPAMPDATPAERRGIYDQMNRALAALHALEPSSIGLETFGKPGNYYARQLALWTRQYRAAETEPLEDVDWVIAWLNEAMVPDDGQVSLSHGDYRIDNMIFGTDGDLRAILDWELSTLGHPLADLAYQCMVWRLPNRGRFKGLAGVDRAAAGLPSDEAYVADYCARRGISVPPDWNFYLTFASFRFLAILQGVLRRGLEGIASNPMGTDVMREAIVALAADARSLARG